MQIECTSCGAEVPASDVNVERMVAKCVKCNAVFDFSGQLSRGFNNEPVRRRPAIALPAHIRVLEDEGGDVEAGYRDDGKRARKLRIARRWFSASAFALLLFCILWDGF